MKYPNSLKENSCIGVTAPSAGVGKYIEDYEKSLDTLKKNHWQILETENVRSEEEVSSTKEERTKEFWECWENPKVDAILCATGGEFLTDMLPSLSEKELTGAKWVMGASDPTNLLYYITTKYDIATMYGHNAGSFDAKTLHPAQQTAIEYLKGNFLPQESYPLYEKDREGRVEGFYHLTEKVEWKSPYEKIECEGRLLGGCLDALRYLLGTKYDYTKEFIEKYKEEGIIWYLDVFTMTTDDFYLTLFQMKEAGWFQYLKAIIVGRVAYPGGYTSMTYERAIQENFPGIPFILDADIGHVAPKMTLVNGSYAKITYQNKKGKIEQFRR